MRRHDDMCVTDGDDAYEAVVEAVTRSAEPMPRESREAVRARLLAAIVPERVPLYRRMMRPAVALATAATLVGGASYAAAASAPGQLLYPLKRGVLAATRSIADVFESPAGPSSVPADVQGEAAGGSRGEGGGSRRPGTRRNPSPGAAVPATPAVGGSKDVPGASKAATATKETPAGTKDDRPGQKDTGKLSSPETTRGQETRTVPGKSNKRSSNGNGGSKARGSRR